MTDINNKQTTESLEQTISDLFQKIFDELEFDCEYKHKDKYEKESYKYNFNNNKLEPTKSSVEDNPGKIMVDKAGYDSMINQYQALLKRKHELEDKVDKLTEMNANLMKASKEVSDNGHKIVDSNSKLQHIISDKLYADGYKIMNDIKIYIEFARKCDAFKNGGFVDMINLIAKTVSDFITSQKEPVFC